jgi:hypothetical protein
MNPGMARLAREQPIHHRQDDSPHVCFHYLTKYLFESGNLSLIIMMIHKMNRVLILHHRKSQMVLVDKKNINHQMLVLMILKSIKIYLSH